MKVRIRKHCKIHGKPAHPGTVHEVPEARAKALTDNGYAEAVFVPPAKPADPPANAGTQSTKPADAPPTKAADAPAQPAAASSAAPEVDATEGNEQDDQG